MKFRNNYFFIILIIFIIFSGIAVYNLSQRPALPFSLTSSEQGLVISEKSRHTLVISIESQNVKTSQEVDEIIDRYKIGQKVSLHFAEGDIREATLIPRNTRGYLILNSLLALSFLIISGIVWKYSIERSDKFFAVTALLFGYILAMGWAGLQLTSWISVPLVIFYFFCYPQAFLSFLYFSYQFPAPTLSKTTLKKRQLILISLGFIVSIILMVLFLQKYYYPSPEAIKHYHGFYRIFRAFILLSLLFSLALFIRNLKRDPTPVNRNKGICI